MRPDRRAAGALRPIKITRHYQQFADGSCLIEMGLTRVICAASVEEKVPPFLKGKGTGWVTAEYGMLPRSCTQRIERESTRGKIGGRTHEIQRLIGRSLRAVTNLAALGERSIWIDCDVLQGDGGTRCAAITGSFIALVEAVRRLHTSKAISTMPVQDHVAAVSVGIVRGRPVLDLAYAEDVEADVDMNVVMTGKGQYVEVQGTAEHAPFGTAEMEQMLALARQGIKELIALQRRELGKLDSSA